MTRGGKRGKLKQRVSPSSHRAWKSGRPRRIPTFPQRRRRLLHRHNFQTTPEAKDQYNFTDPESRIMKSSSEGFVQAYNAQIVVEPAMQAANDKEQVGPMVEAVEEQSGQRPEAMIADSGYGSEKNLEHLESEKRPERRIEAFIATERQKHGERKVARRGPLPKGATRVERMKRKLLTKVGASVYAARKGIVEP